MTDTPSLSARRFCELVAEYTQEQRTMSYMYDLFTTVLFGNVGKARELLKHGRYDVNCTDENGKTPLHKACYWGHVDMVRMLISEFQADTRLQNMLGHTPLQEAVYWGREEVSLTLITEFGCDTTIRARDGRTLLHSASKEGCLNLAKLLIRDYNAARMRTKTHHFTWQLKTGKITSHLH